MEEVKKQALFGELGTTGLKRYGVRSGVYEEFIRDLGGERAIKIYREMRDNDPIVGAVLFAIEMLLRNVTWRVEGEGEETVAFVESCLYDMSHSWEDLIAEILSMLPYGFSWHEVVYKRRLGDNKDPSKRSRYTDGRIGWRKLPIRSQDSLTEWVFDDEGGIQAFVQVAPPKYNTIEIPIERSLLFRLGIHKGNPQGRSILRNAYRPWYIKKTLEEIEAIGAERDLAGLPVIWYGVEAEGMKSDLEKILRNVRRDEQDGLLLPLIYDDSGNKVIQFELLSAPGKRQLDVGAMIDRYDRRIAMTVMAQFIMLSQGEGGTGSYALASSATSLFATALGAVLKGIAGVFNQHGIPRLLAVNGIKSEGGVELVPGDIETPDLKELGAFITACAGAGMPLFPDEGLENYIRGVANWPDRPEDGIQSPAPPMKPLPKPPTDKEAEESEEEQ